MIVIHAEQAEDWWSPPLYQRELTILLSPELQEVSKDLSIGMVVVTPGESGDPHTHENSQESWFVLSGRGKLHVGSKEAELAPDTIVVTPAGIEHQILNDGEKSLKAVFLFSPSGTEGHYFPG